MAAAREASLLADRRSYPIRVRSPAAHPTNDLVAVAVCCTRARNGGGDGLFGAQPALSTDRRALSTDLVRIIYTDYGTAVVLTCITVQSSPSGGTATSA